MGCGWCVSVTQSINMTRSVILVATVLLSLPCPGQTTPPAAAKQDEDFQVYTEHPRLFLPARRLKLLKRERERTSIRWHQFETLVAGRAPMTEPGFAWSLYYQISGREEFGKQAVQWSLGAGATDLRQLALVFD